MPQQPSDWQTVTPEPDDWQAVSSQPAATAKLPTPEQSWYDSIASYIPQPVKSGWETANKSVFDYAPDWMNPSKRVASRIAEESGASPEDWNIPFTGGAKWKGLRQGIEQGAADTINSLASPLNLATMGAGYGAVKAGSAGLIRTGKALAGVEAALSAPIMAHGAATIADPNKSFGERAFGLAEVAGGAAGVKSGVSRARIPVRGAGALEDMPVRQPAASIEPSAVTPESMPVRQPTGRMEVLPPDEMSTWHQQERDLRIKEGRDPNTGAVPEDMRKSDLRDWASWEHYRDAEMGAGRPDPGPWKNDKATPADIDVPQAGEFDPATLKGLEPAAKPELEFLDPKTGELKPASQAKPGDVPLPPETTGRSISNSEMGRPDEIVTRPTPEPKQQVPGGNEFQPDIPMVDEPTLGGTSPRFGTPEAATAGEAPRLPQNLAGAKPRFNAGTQFYNPQFTDDLDKALYIIAQTRKSTHDAKYLKFVMDHTGLDESGAQALGLAVKASVRAAAKNAPGGDIQIPSIAGKMRFPKTGVSTAGDVKGYLGGKPQVSTGEVNPANVRPAAEVVESLNQRLQKAIENPDPTTAPKDISELLDEAAEVLAKDPAARESGIIRQVLNANKALLTSWDLSAPGRQGKAFMLNKAWWTSLDDMVKAWGSKEAAHNINQSILDHPSGYFQKPISESGKVGKSFAENMGLDIAAHEEMFTGVVERMGAKIPLVQKSSRAHTAFLNKLRSDQFVSMMDSAKKAGANPEANELLAKSYAKFINDATGRGSLNISKWKLERNVNTLNDVFFAPKNMSGQIRTWNGVLNPMKYANYDSVMRKQALRSLFAVASMGLGVGEMARMAGAKVSNDPTSADFRKIKIGDTRIDPFGGYQQFPVAAMKLLTRQSTSSISGKTTDLMANKFGQQTRQSVAERFFINRLSPAGSFIYAWMSNREFDGKPFEVKRALYERTFPIAAKDLAELAMENPALAAVLAVPTELGLIGTQHYTGR